jgi:hypothetical protein
MCSLFFIHASVCCPNIRDSILRGVHTLPVHLNDCFFVFPINIKNKRTRFNRHGCLNVDPSLYKIEKYFLYELEHHTMHGVKSDYKMNRNG